MEENSLTDTVTDPETGKSKRKRRTKEEINKSRMELQNLIQNGLDLDSIGDFYGWDGKKTASELGGIASFLASINTSTLKRRFVSSKKAIKDIVGDDQGFCKIETDNDDNGRTFYKVIPCTREEIQKG